MTADDLRQRIRTLAERAGVRWTPMAVCEVCGEDAFWDETASRCVHPSCEPEPEEEPW